MLTKEECQKALDHFEKCYWDQDNSYGAMNGVRKDLDILNKLIHEHFSNPPLKWEELENGKPIWDNKNKEWLFVNNVLSISSEVKGKDYRKFMKVGYKGRKIYFNVEQCEIDFEDDRFTERK